MTEPFQTAGLLGDGDGKDRLLLLTDHGTFGNIAQPLEIHVCPGIDADKRLIPAAALPHIFEQSGHTQCTCRFDNGAGRLIDCLDAAAQLIGIDPDNLVDMFATQLEGQLPHFPDRYTICKNTGSIKRDSLPAFQRACHGIAVGRFNTDHFDLLSEIFYVRGNAC